MAGFGNPLAPQGILNKVLPHLIVTLNPALTVTAPYMSKSLISVTFDDPFVTQDGTATGVVQVPAPYVMTTVTVGLLRSQSLANTWLNTTQVGALLGPVTVYSDSTTLQAIELISCSIAGLDPGAFDGNDPTLKVTIKGVFLTNSTLWTGVVT